jgi:threonine/homoserine/homoserine lactone efflux protein
MKHGLLGFAAVAALLVVTPGPDFAVVLPNALRSRRSGAATAFGTASGLALHALAAALGLSVILASSATAFTVVKVAGAAFLCFLGVRALYLSRRGHGHDLSEAPPEKPRSAYQCYRQGFLTNVLNPKAPVIYLSILPQFLVPGQDHGVQLALMSGTLVAIALTWYLLLTLLVQPLRQPIVRFRHWIDRVTGTILIVLGIRLAFERRAG